MGILKGGLLFIVGACLLLSLFVMNGFLTLGLSLSYDNVKSGIQEGIDDIAAAEGVNLTESITDSYDTIQSSCNGEGDFVYTNEDYDVEVNVPCETVVNGTESIVDYIVDEEPQAKVVRDNLTEGIEEQYDTIAASCENPDSFVFVQEDYDLEFEIPCSVAEEGPDAVVNYSFENVTEQIYYDDYDCDYWDCIQEDEPFVLLSEESRDYWMGKFYVMLIISLVFASLVYFLVDNKMNFPILVGILLIISALPMVKLYDMIVFLADKSWLQFLGFLEFLFNASGRVFSISLVLGILLIGTGIGLNFWKFGSWLGSLGKKDESVKEEKVVERKGKK